MTNQQPSPLELTVLLIVADQACVALDKVSRATKLTDHEMDSLDIIEIVMECEDVFAIYIDDSSGDAFNTYDVGQVIDYLEREFPQLKNYV